MVTPEIGDVYGVHEPLPMEYAPRKIKLPKGGTEAAPFEVKEYHLDTNHHVNNGQYVRMAMNTVLLGSEVRQLRVEYKKQALLGDRIIPVVYEEEGQVFVSLNDEKGKAYAVVQFFVFTGDRRGKI